MKHLALVVCLLVTVAFFSACKIFRPVAEPIPHLEDAAAIWTYITVDDPYTEWKQFDNAIGKIDGAPPHGNKVQVFPNELAYDSLYKDHVRFFPEGLVPAPVYRAEPGSIIVMENYGCDEGQLIFISLMYKRKGFAPSSGDWYWAVYYPDGQIANEGKIESCIDCHVSMAFDDYTFIRKW